LLAISVMAIVAVAAVGVLAISRGGRTSAKASTCGVPYVTNPHGIYITEFDTPSPCASPNGITVDPSGTVWYVEQNDSSLVSLNPHDGVTRVYSLPVLDPITWGLAATADGDVWMTDANSSSVIRFDPVTTNFTVYNLPKGSFPMQLAVGPDGNVWFSELYGHRIGEIDLATGQMSQFAEPNNSTGPGGLAFDSRGMLWIALASFNQSVPNAIGSFNLTNDTFSIYYMPSSYGQPTGIAVDNAGYVWFAEHGPSLLGRFDPSTGDFIQVATSLRPGVPSSLPYWILKDSNGDFWINEHYGNKIARLDPENLTLTEYDIPTVVPTYDNISNSLTIALDPSGNVWFTELSPSKVGLLLTSLAPGASISAPDNISLSPGANMTIQLATTQFRGYLGSLSFNASDSENPNGLLQNISVQFGVPAPSPAGEASSFTVQATISTQTSLLPGEYTITLTMEGDGWAVSKILFLDVGTASG